MYMHQIPAVYSANAHGLRILVTEASPDHMLRNAPEALPQKRLRSLNLNTSSRHAAAITASAPIIHQSDRLMREPSGCQMLSTKKLPKVFQLSARAATNSRPTAITSHARSLTMVPKALS